MNLRVLEIIPETHDSVTLIMEDAEDGGRPFDFLPGQYLTFRFDTLGEKPLVRSYTMSGSPLQDKHTAITVKIVTEGRVSTFLCNDVKVDDILRARGPMGRFVYQAEKDAPHLVMIAGGSGVTPFVSMIRQYSQYLGQNGSPQELTLLVCFRSQKDLILWDELKKYQNHEKIHIHTTLSRETAEDSGFLSGRITSMLLEKVFSGNYRDRTFMTCGPQGMMDTVIEHLHNQQVDQRQIKMESFEN